MKRRIMVALFALWMFAACGSEESKPHVVIVDGRSCIQDDHGISCDFGGK